MKPILPGNRFYFILILLFSLFLTCSAEASTWQVFTAANGLPSHQVTSFSSFSKWLAVGTDAGLAIYNGDDCQWAVPELPQQIASAPVKDLAFDEDGGLWVASANGLFHISDGFAKVYSTEDGLPNSDVDRIQVVSGSVIAGCFGGYIARAVLPGGGKTTFQPINFASIANLKITSVGISALALNDAFNGFYGTLGNGLGEIDGSSDRFLKNTDGMAGDWINDIWGFTGKKKETKQIAVSPEGLSFLKNGVLTNAFAPLQDVPWFTSIITVNNTEDVIEAMEDHASTDEQNNFLKDFLEGRSLYLGSKNNGLWRFQKGKWENFNTSNSSLPSDKINRLYVMQRFVVVATDGGLVLIPLDSFQNDELKYSAIGTPYSKTIFSPPPVKEPFTQYFQILRGKDYWFVHEKGISRFITKNAANIQAPADPDSDSFSGSPKKFISVNSRFADSFLTLGKTSANFSGMFPAAEKTSEKDSQMNTRWQLYTKETYDQSDVAVFPIYSEKVKAIVDKVNQCLWLIFDQKYLCRMSVSKQLNEKTKKTIEAPTWEFVIEDAPWLGEIKLTTLWMDSGKLHIGTDGQGFYVLTNPESKNSKLDPFQWQHYGVNENLPFMTVLGFSRWHFNGEDAVAILHPRSVSAWSEGSFHIVEMGGLEKYTCIAGDQIGNLWVGSEAGLFRMTPEGTRKEYTAFKTGFESNNITAISVPPADSSRLCGVWVACDEKTKKADDGRLWGGLDEPPMAVRMPGGEQGNGNWAANKLKLVEQAIDGGSLHFFNGTVWEKWSYGGVNDIMIENEFIWLSSNLRIRRIKLAR